MREPFYRSKRTIDRIALIIAILSVFIFIFSCLFNMYSYSITPTITPTFTSTPTVTKTPRPSITPTLTLTMTMTATELTPSQTVTPFVEELPEPAIMLLNELSARGFTCGYSLLEQTGLLVECGKVVEDIQTQIRLEYGGDDPISLLLAQLEIDPPTGIAIEPVFSDIIWFSQIPYYSFDATTPTSETATQTPLTTETFIPEEADALTTWLTETIPQITEGLPFQFEQEPFRFTISIENEIFNFWIEKMD